MIKPITVNPPPSPAILAKFSDSEAPTRNIAPPIMINAPVTISIMPNTLKGGFFEMKNATNDKIIGGIPSPTPRVIASNGKNPSPAPPPPTMASAPYIIKRTIEIPDNTSGADTIFE